MRRIIIVEIGFCETFGINNRINLMTIMFVSQQMRWYNGKGNGLLPW
jgi:hypothetical protein